MLQWGHVTFVTGKKEGKLKKRESSREKRNEEWGLGAGLLAGPVQGWGMSPSKAGPVSVGKPSFLGQWGWAGHVLPLAAVRKLCVDIHLWYHTWKGLQKKNNCNDPGGVRSYFLQGLESGRPGAERRTAFESTRVEKMDSASASTCAS